jgi:hypothetical protein
LQAWCAGLKVEVLMEIKATKEIVRIVCSAGSESTQPLQERRPAGLCSGLAMLS